MNIEEIIKTITKRVNTINNTEVPYSQFAMEVVDIIDELVSVNKQMGNNLNYNLELRFLKLEVMSNIVQEVYQIYSNDIICMKVLSVTKEMLDRNNYSGLL